MAPQNKGANHSQFTLLYFLSNLRGKDKCPPLSTKSIAFLPVHIPKFCIWLYIYDILPRWSWKILNMTNYLLPQGICALVFGLTYIIVCTSKAQSGNSVSPVPKSVKIDFQIHNLLAFKLYKDVVHLF